MSADAGGREHHLLAVEDEPDHLMAVEMLFQGVPGIAFHGAGSTREAEEILRKEPIDLILLDLALPGEDGISFCKRIKAMELFKDIPVIAFSAFPRQIYGDKAREAGCVAYLDKPFHPKDLLSLVKRHLG